ncbi:hypothetical protein PHISCL_09553 [Aspergillus sclerotialis]|uniref:Uncharacterized protein n=1 Tax=Aspergillus sclerotialis TaxID=2070753 RepID=A0A3A2Z601_9EURO|nr:hypothetical protein PHISCL_09553 [Aspergillus sclerotialis]
MDLVLPYNALIVNDKAYASFLQASNPNLRETATPVNETTKTADLIIRYPRRPTFDQVILLIFECKRANKGSGLHALEEQLFDKVMFAMSDTGLAIADNFFAAVAFGSKIRIFRCRRNPQAPGDSVHYNDIQAIWNGGEYVDEQLYKDAGNAEDARQIHHALMEIKNHARP